MRLLLLLAMAISTVAYVKLDNQQVSGTTCTVDDVEKVWVTSFPPLGAGPSAVHIEVATGGCGGTRTVQSLPCCTVEESE
jgi:hypothetical protein